ncbi:hypothetical protein M8818_003638 [Zalaria obscura]|uniref:Uncharacterized protein n=1 Tax=Zalaria obscura TaxID=2024903 RepID=A0ACC3SIB0_9PEZI
MNEKDEERTLPSEHVYTILHVGSCSPCLTQLGKAISNALLGQAHTSQTVSRIVLTRPLLQPLESSEYKGKESDEDHPHRPEVKRAAMCCNAFLWNGPRGIANLAM